MSGMIFVVIEVLFLGFGFSRCLLFGCLASILGVFLILGLFLWPNKAFLPGDMIKAHKSGESSEPGYQDHWSHPFYSVKRTNVEDKPGKSKGSGCDEFFKACRTTKFLFITIFFVLTNFNYNFFVGTASQQLILKGDNGALLSAFAIILPAGVVFLPIISCTLDCFKDFGLCIMITATVASGVIYGTMVLIPKLEFMWIVFIVFSFHRQSFFTVTFTFIAASFDFRLYGRLSGTTVLLGGLCNLFSYVLLIAAETSGSFFYVNVGLLCITLCTAFFPLYVGCVAYNNKVKKRDMKGIKDSMIDKNFIELVDINRDEVEMINSEFDD